jgi:hypothetical protein
MNNEREFKDKEFKVGLKFSAILSVDDIDDLKEKIPEVIKKRIQTYNYQYCVDHDHRMGNMNHQAYFRLNISEYNGVSDEEKRIMNTDVAAVRRACNIYIDFTERQKEIINTLYLRLEEEINTMFNYGEFWQQKLLTHRFNEEEVKKIRVAEG